MSRATESGVGTGVRVARWRVRGGDGGPRFVWREVAAVERDPNSRLALATVQKPNQPG